MLRKTYSPEPFDTAVCSTEVSTLARTMLAPGITDPLGSRITPFTLADESWAFADPARSKKRKLSKPVVRMPGRKLPACLEKPCARRCMDDLSQSVVGLKLASGSEPLR